MTHNVKTSPDGKADILFYGNFIAVKSLLRDFMEGDYLKVAIPRECYIEGIVRKLLVLSVNAVYLHADHTLLCESALYFS